MCRRSILQLFCVTEKRLLLLSKMSPPTSTKHRTDTGISTTVSLHPNNAAVSLTYSLPSSVRTPDNDRETEMTELQCPVGDAFA